MASPESLLHDLFAPAFASLHESADPLVRRSQFADFQLDGALPLARRLGQPPREVAGTVLSLVESAPLVESVEIAGPGYLNVRLATSFLESQLTSLNADDRLGVPLVPVPRRVLIDYSGPNVAKEMHVGHLRSTVIGDAAARLLTWLGHEVVRVNHLGDWGTPFGMLIEHLLDLGEAETAHELSMGDLSGFYHAARAKFDADEGFAHRARLRVVAMQSGDEATLRLWRLLVRESQTYFLAVYERLGVTLTPAHFQSESSYQDRIASTVDELDRLGLLRISDGALCAFPSGFGDLPIIVRKSDGGYGYGATDLTAIRHRTTELKMDRILYVVATPQHQHFEMVFQTAREAGWLAPPTEAVHIGFGQVLGTSGRRLASRTGETIRLADLLDEAVSRAGAIVADKNPSLSSSEQAAVARAVGIGAVKYADLSSDRINDYVFDWDRMLATTGDTAAYLQYSHARVRSIFARGEATPDPGARIMLTVPAERALALELLAYPSVVTPLGSTLAFHRLTGYLQRLAGAFTTFHDQCPVLRSAPEIRASRLALCDLTGRTIALGLDLLGIQSPTPM